MTEPLERRTYVVETGCPARMARAYALYQLTRPGTIVAAVMFALAALLGVLTGTSWETALGIALLLMIGLSALTRYRGISRMLAAGAYRPGHVVTADWYADRVVVSTADAHSTHRLADVRRVGADPDVVLVSLRSSRTVLMLPVDLVGDRGRELLASGPAAARP